MIIQTTITIATILGNVTDMVTAAVGWIGSFINAITSNPLLLMFVLVAMVGLGVGLLRRLIRL